MKQNYTDWIKINYPTPESARNKCREAAIRIVDRFPVLQFQCGFVKHQMHCWSKSENGEIIDPTKHQFAEDINEENYILVADHLLRKDQVDELACAVFLDDGRVVVGI